MVTLFTNHAEFANDIAEEIRLFTDTSQAVTVSPLPAVCKDGMTVTAELVENADVWTARARAAANGKIGDYTYVCKAVEGGDLLKKRYRKRALKIAVFRAMRQVFDAFTPWGSLTGIRPTRLLRELSEQMGEQEALRFLEEEFDVAPEKLALAREIAQIQRPILAQGHWRRDLDVYIGIPFCKTRCLYCSFASEVRRKDTDMATYIAALKEDIRLGAAAAQENGYRIRSMYMGGGTPTVLTEEELTDVLSCALAAYGGFGRELTVEAGRPDTITRGKLRAIRELGAGRISINPQTMNPFTLEIIGRNHGPEEVHTAYQTARDMGFCINMDLIAGLPGEDAEDVKRTLDEIVRLAPDNMTMHTLALKRSSVLKERLSEFQPAPAETADEMVRLGAAAAERMGMRPYYMYRQKYMRGNLENVGYALPGKECLYNIDMMEETTSIMAHGAGSMTKRIFGGEQRVERIPSPKDIGTYIAKVETLSAHKRALFGAGDALAP